MIDDLGSGRFVVRCDQCGGCHHLIGRSDEVEDAALRDGYIRVQVAYLKHDCVETKMFCPVCASIHFGQTFEEVLDPDPEFESWLDA